MSVCMYESLSAPGLNQEKPWVCGDIMAGLVLSRICKGFILSLSAPGSPAPITTPPHTHPSAHHHPEVCRISL